MISNSTFACCYLLCIEPLPALAVTVRCTENMSAESEIDRGNSHVDVAAAKGVSSERTKKIGAISLTRRVSWWVTLATLLAVPFNILGVGEIGRAHV